MKKLKLHVLLYKAIGALLIGLFVFYLQKSYFSVPKYGDLPALIFLLVIEAVFLLLPYIADKIAATLLLVLYTVYYIGEKMYYFFFKQYIFINSAFDLIGEAKDYSGDFFRNFSSTEIITLLLLVLVIAAIWIIGRKKGYNRLCIPVIILVSLILGATSYLLLDKNSKKLDDAYLDPFNNNYTDSDRYVYESIPSSEQFVELFGIEEYLMKDLEKNILRISEVSDKEIEEIGEFLSQNLPYESNEYTGIFEGKHLIIIEAESLNMAAINEDLTPTLYRLFHEGWNFTNFLAPMLTGSTSDAEVMTNTSLIPINKGEIVSHKYFDNYYPTTLAKGFLKAGYPNAMSYHTGYYMYYSRDKFFPNLGYDPLFGPSELTIESGSSDLEIVKPLTYITIGMDKSYSFWITYSGHQPYTADSIDKEGNDNTKAEYKEYLQIVKDYYPNLKEEAQVYIAKNISLDKAVEFLIANFRFANKIDDLVIVIYGDHFVKGEFDEDNIYANTGSTFKDTPLVIYNSTIEGKEIKKYCTNIDILPTLFNLFNIEYDKSTILGNDIFDDRYHGFNFTPSWDITTDDFAYSLTKGFTRLSISEDEAKKEVERYQKYQEISNNIFISDYFNPEKVQ
ncbi:MAG: LTA synthase family protein [Erysipelotrichaceae bacterium]|nr:LTA synthase family protein [Erysipelotrichaceae bacterium]